MIEAAKDDPQVKVAASELGKTAVTLTKAVNLFLIPLAAMNYAVDKARNYFESNFAADFARVAKDIPPDDILEPKASMAGPLLQALAFSHEETELRQMYSKNLTVDRVEPSSKRKRRSKRSGMSACMRVSCR